MLEGKGFYVWKIERCENGNVEEIAGKAVVANFGHVLIKIADGPYTYNYDWEKRIDLIPPLAKALHEFGIEVWG